MKYVTVATAVALVLGVVIGAAYGFKISFLGSLAQKLPVAAKVTAA